jgi:NAD(P)-dependent dehydrogenase (short-subunit alcohol dehydrogenase family)
VFVGARNRKVGRKAVDEIAKEGGKASFLEVDVSDNDSVIAAEREFSKMADLLDVLVNNAGIVVDRDEKFWNSAMTSHGKPWRQIRLVHCA